MSNIRQLLKSLREYKTATLLAPVLVICEVLMEVFIPYLMSKLIDYGINAGNLSVVIKYGIALLVMAVVSLAFGALSGTFAAKASAGFAKNLRQDMYYKVQDFSFSNIDHFSTAGLVTRLTTDVTNVQMAFQMMVRTIARAPIMMISALFFTFRLNARLSMIYLIIMPLLLFALIMLAKTVMPVFRRVFKTYDRMNEVVQENLRGIRVVKSFRREEYEEKKFTDISGRLFGDFSKAEGRLAFNMLFMTGAIHTTLIVIAWFGSRLIVNSHETALSTGQLMSFITYSMQILMCLMMLSMVFVMMTISQASIQRISEVLNETSDITNGEDPVETVADGSIEFDHVQFSYSSRAGKPVLDDINLRIESGETIGIIGGTGSSKSSLVQLIPRLYDVNEGSLKVGGTDVRKYDLEVLRDNVAMVLQKNVLFSGTIRENLKWGKEDATDEEIDHVCRLACADEFISSFPLGYETYIEQGGTNVSGGQRQRLCIARALLKHPKILILDDSTSAVDTKTDKKIRQAFLEEIPEVTKIIIAQRIASVMDADRIFVMDDGKVVASGTHAELLAASVIYREVFESQQKGGLGDE